MALSVRELRKAFGPKIVLDGFSRDFPETGTVALLGPSGCGKTTLLRLLAGLERPDGGQVCLPARVRLSMVFQEDRLLPALDALGNVRIVLDPDDEDWARACLAGCGLADAAGLYPSELSGGMQRRVALARAVAYDGDLLLLDEPFKGLDTATKRDVMRFVFEQRSRRASLVLLVTHDVDEALEAADTIFVLRGTPLKVAHVVDVRGAREQLRAQVLALLEPAGEDERET